MNNSFERTKMNMLGLLLKQKFKRNIVYNKQTNKEVNLNKFMIGFVNKT